MTKAKVCAHCSAPPVSRRIYCAKCRDPELCMFMDCPRPRYGKRVYCKLHYHEYRKHSGKQKVPCTGGCGRFTVLGECRACKRLRARKKCAGPCGEIKLLASFNVRKSSPDGKASTCKECTRKQKPRPTPAPKRHYAEETLGSTCQYMLSQPISRKIQPCPERDRNYEL